MKITKEKYQVVGLTGSVFTENKDHGFNEYKRIYARLSDLNMLSNVYPALWLIMEFEDGGQASVRLK